ncbi:MAG: hypothetical protein KDB80_01855 [Planctomycetes bacterium]|nr:hypothetical protein [Planctomycetota bacterium]
MADSEATINPWFVRGAIGIALGLTVWLAGPRAVTVLKSRFGGAASGPAVDLSKVGIDRVPEWLRGPVLEQVLLDLEPTLSGAIGWHDESGCEALCAVLARSPWVADARLRRRYPDRFGLQVELRRPVLAVTADRRIRAMVAEDGFVLPPPPRVPDLPIVELPEGVVDATVREGEACGDPRVRCAVAVAIEWRDHVAPAVADAPALLEIDARNLGGRFIADPRYSEIAIALASADGGATWMQYGRSVEQGGAVDAETKAAILASVLAEFPGLRGLANGDLRLRNRWRDCLVRRTHGDLANGSMRLPR